MVDAAGIEPVHGTPGASIGHRLSIATCAAATKQFGGGAPARLLNLGSWASGTSGCTLFSEERANAREFDRNNSQANEIKGIILFPTDLSGSAQRREFIAFLYNHRASYLFG
ncbi:hypothetical protein [Burkholderia sp. Ax-1719]|uniref:hypothetical protein n=1 Tax=Burkholderia sp. Ax-1719 TaxID=2608334 RepID=UPI0014221139|nr:hypothetical protein [Burkholderia sp. Ax-1719]NIE66494.1 hypothetical protein [Burkholderia sp. Ax-1719]